MLNFLRSQYDQLKKDGIAVLIKKIIKLIKITLLFLLSLFFLPISILLLLISKLILIRFAEIPTNRIGHFAMEVDLYITNIKSLNKKTIDIFCLQIDDNFVSNQKLFDEFKKHILVLPRILILPLILNAKHYKFFSSQTFPLTKTKDRDLENIIDKTPVNLTLSNEDIKIGEEFLSKIGNGEKNIKFVIMIVRDSSYLNNYFNHVNKMNAKDWSYHNFRDGNVDDYLPACEELTKLGYYVFRMGQVVSKKLDTKNPMIIDYASNGMRTELLDIFLASKCEFCISNGTGYDALPMIFRKPVIICNYAPVAQVFTHSKKFLITFRHHYSKKLNKRLNLKEIFDEQLANIGKADGFTNEDLILQDNTPLELKEAILEMESFVRNKEFENENSNILNNEFWKVYSSMIKKHNLSYLQGNLLARLPVKFIERNKYLIY
jgi:putative glycosyltransferase (TIGR04372 family)